MEEIKREMTIIIEIQWISFPPSPSIPFLLHSIVELLFWTTYFLFFHSIFCWNPFHLQQLTKIIQRERGRAEKGYLPRMKLEKFPWYRLQDNFYFTSPYNNNSIKFLYNVFFTLQHHCSFHPLVSQRSWNCTKCRNYPLLCSEGTSQGRTLPSPSSYPVLHAWEKWNNGEDAWDESRGEKIE